MLPGTVGLIMATEVVKWILGLGQSLVGRLILFDSLQMRFREVRMRKDENCALCGTAPSVHGLIDYDTFCNVQLPGAAEAPNAPPKEVSVQQLRQVLESGRPVALLDVRETHEWDITHIKGARLTPLSALEKHIPQLDPQAETYLYCYKGMRSLTALEKLRAQGFQRLHSVAGGIDRWAEEIDPQMPRY